MPKGVKKGQKIRSKLDPLKGEFVRIATPFPTAMLLKIDELVVEIAAQAMRQYMQARRTERAVRSPPRGGSRPDVVRLLVEEALAARERAKASTQVAATS